MFWNILNRFRPKIFSTENFWLCHCFIISAILTNKWLSSRDKNTRLVFVDFEIFSLKYVLKHFESIPTKTNFDQNFLTLSFFTILAILVEKRQSPRKKFYTGKIFDFEIYSLKYILKYFKSIPTKKIFGQNFLALSFFNYFGPVGQNTTESEQKNLHSKKFSISRFLV